MNEKQQRLVHANELLKCIASCGRKFFQHTDGTVSRFEFDENNRLWFIDKYPSSRRRIYMHMPKWKIDRGFTEGGTLKDLMLALREYILRDTQVSRSRFYAPDWYSSGDPWGYKDDMRIVQDKAIELGIIAATYEAEQEVA